MVMWSSYSDRIIKCSVCFLCWRYTYKCAGVCVHTHLHRHICIHTYTLLLLLPFPLCSIVGLLAWLRTHASLEIGQSDGDTWITTVTVASNASCFLWLWLNEFTCKELRAVSDMIIKYQLLSLTDRARFQPWMSQPSLPGSFELSSLYGCSAECSIPRHQTWRICWNMSALHSLQCCTSEKSFLHGCYSLVSKTEKKNQRVAMPQEGWVPA